MEEERGDIDPNEDTTIPQRKVTMKLIKEKGLRRACYKKRRTGLLKKMEEITTLCNIEACAIIFGPGDTLPTVWPSNAVAARLLQRFQNMPEAERLKKMVNHHTYMQEKTKRMQRQLMKLKESNEQKEMSVFMHQIYNEGKPLSDFAVNDLRRLLCYVEEKLKFVRKRISHFEQQLALPPNTNPSPPPVPISCPQDNGVQDDIESWFNIDGPVLEQHSALNSVKDNADQMNSGVDNNRMSNVELIPTYEYYWGDADKEELVQGNPSGFNIYESDHLMMLPQSKFGGFFGESDSTVLSHGNFGGFNGESGLGFSVAPSYFGDLNAEIDNQMALPQGNFSALIFENGSVGVPHNVNYSGGINGEENLGLLHGSSVSEIGGSSTWIPHGHIGSTIGENGIRIEQHYGNYGGPINISGLQQCHPSNFGAKNGEAAMGEFNANFATSNTVGSLNTELLTHEKFANSSGEGSDFGIPISFQENFPTSNRLAGN